MKAPIVIIGIGELGGVFARGFLRCGFPVFPIVRDADLIEECQRIPSPQLVLVTVQENELDNILSQIPEAWLGKVGLVQNELLPRDWQRHHLDNPTVTIVWFEKKKNLELTNILYSPSFGPSADLMSQALQALEVPAPVLQNENDLLYEMLRKALYILTVNISGLVNNWKVGNLWLHHQSLAREIAIEVISIQEYLVKQKLPYDKLIAGMVEGINDCPDRHCLGRSAFNRLERILNYAKQAQIETPKLLEIYQQSKMK